MKMDEFERKIRPARASHDYPPALCVVPASSVQQRCNSVFDVV